MTAEIPQVKSKDVALFCLYQHMRIAREMLSMAYRWAQFHYPERWEWISPLGETICVLPDIFDEMIKEAEEMIANGRCA